MPCMRRHDSDYLTFYFWQFGCLDISIDAAGQPARLSRVPPAGDWRWAKIQVRFHTTPPGFRGLDPGTDTCVVLILAQDLSLKDSRRARYVILTRHPIVRLGYYSCKEKPSMLMTINLVYCAV